MANIDIPALENELQDHFKNIIRASLAGDASGKKRYKSDVGKTVIEGLMENSREGQIISMFPGLKEQLMKNPKDLEIFLTKWLPLLLKIRQAQGQIPAEALPGGDLQSVAQMIPQLGT